MAEELIYKLEGEQHRFPLEGDEITIGRSPDCDLTIKHASISRKHARLTRENGVWHVRDLGSKNGTRINDLPGTDAPLRPGDRIYLHEIALMLSDGTTPVSTDDRPAEALAALADVGGAGSQTVFRSTVNFAALAAAGDAPTAGPRPIDRMQRLVSIVTAASEAILGSPGLDATFERVLSLIFEHLPVQRGFIALWDDQKQDLVTKCAKHKSGDGEQIRFSRTIAQRVYTEKMAVLTMDAQMDDRFAAGQSIAALGIRSAMAAPLWNRERVEGLIYVDTPLQTKAFDDFDLDLLSALGNHLAVALEQARLQEHVLEKEKLERELSVARDIQMGILPRTMPELAGYDLAGVSFPADQTGGDTFDMVPLDPRRLMLLLGDATGHGIGPALSVTQVRSMLRIALRLGADLDAAFSAINDQLSMDLADNRFVTAFLGVLDSESHRVEYHSGGQGPLLHFHAASGKCTWHPASTVPLGFMEGMKLKEAPTMDLAPGDILGLMTDGIFESENRAGVQLGEKGVAELIRQHHAGPMEALRDVLLKKAIDHAEGTPQADDITIVLVRRLP